MAKIFEDYFTDLQADMVSICLEYIGNVAEKIFIYGSMEDGTTSFNVFFRVKGKLLHLNEVNTVLEDSEKIDDHIDRQFGVLKIGVEDLEKIENLCKEYNMATPTEIKIEYDVLKNSMDADYQYDVIYSNTPDRTDDDIFNEWFDEMNRNI